MRIVRFDEEVSVPAGRPGEGHRTGHLTGPGGAVSVAVVYIPPGGALVAGEGQQLLGVVSGSGWAYGEDGVRRELRPGYGALWDEGEKRESGSLVGMTAVNILGLFDVWALQVTQDIVVSDYEPVWHNWFETLHARVWPAVEDLALRIDHVGSTAVPGLAAKPIIDLDIVVATEDSVAPVIERLSGLGYRWRGDLGVPGRESLSSIEDSSIEDSGPPHHLYLVVEGSKAYLDHWLLRDLLRADPAVRRRYGDLKRRNAELAGGDMDFYVEAKASIVAELLARRASGSRIAGGRILKFG